MQGTHSAVSFFRFQSSRPLLTPKNSLQVAIISRFLLNLRRSCQLVLSRPAGTQVFMICLSDLLHVDDMGLPLTHALGGLDEEEVDASADSGSEISFDPQVVPVDCEPVPADIEDVGRVVDTVRRFSPLMFVGVCPMRAPSCITFSFSLSRCKSTEICARMHAPHAYQQTTCRTYVARPSNSAIC